MTPLRGLKVEQGEHTFRMQRGNEVVTGNMEVGKTPVRLEWNISKGKVKAIYN